MLIVKISRSEFDSKLEEIVTGDTENTKWIEFDGELTSRVEQLLKNCGTKAPISKRARYLPVVFVEDV